MRNNLIPTAVTDKNGKQTTVHKRAGQPSPSAARLAGVKPSLNSAFVAQKRERFDTKLIYPTWSISAHGVEPRTGEGSFLARAGMVDREDSKDVGVTELTHDELYGFMRFGISHNEAAYLARNGATLDDLMGNEQFVAALPGSLSEVRSGEKVSVADAVDRLHEHMVSPVKVAALLKNGLNDSHFERAVISDEQIIELFGRFKYQSSTVGAKTNAAVTLDALIEGRLPSDLMDKEFERTTITAAADAMYPRGKQGKEKRLDDSEIAYLQANPDEIVTTVRMLNELEDKRSRDFINTFRSIQKFGYEDTLKYDPNLLLMEPGGGEVLGVEGARKVNEVVQALSDLNARGRNSFSDASATAGYYWNRETRETLDIEYSDIALMQRAGVTNEKIVHALSSGQMDSKGALAVLQGDTTTALVSGWL